MKRGSDRTKGSLTAWMSTLLLIGSAITFFVFYYMTRYLAFYLMAMVTLMPAVVYTVLLAVGALRAPAEAPDAVDTDAAGTEADKPEEATPKAHRLWRGICRGLGKVLRGCARFFYAHRLWLILIPILLAPAVCHVFFWLAAGRMTSVYKIGYAIPVILLCLFVLFIVFDKWCKYAEGGDKYIGAVLRNLRSALGVTRFAILISMVVIVIRLLGFYELQKWLVIAMYVIFIYETVFLLLSLAVRLLRRELLTKPDLSIPMPQLLGSARELGVLSYLEENTGITMRSLWSMRFIKAILPYTMLFGCLILWVSTGIIQIESHQQGAVYRFGRLQEDTLQPGLHMTLPWPMDRVDVYDTDTVRKVTIGYKSTEAGDNTWTGNHGSSEYKLLLGSGDEVISINLRLEYRIDDLGDYLRSSAAPDKLLEAKAYELVIDHTISSDLETLLAVDRSAFAADFHSDLTETLSPYKTGLEVVSVVLESIHPPVEIAATYQGVVSAEIQAARSILDAQAKAAVTVAEAQVTYDTAVSTATADRYTRVAQAQADVAEFMAGVAADQAHSDAYRYYKQLSAVSAAYSKAKLVIVGDGIHSSNLYFGSLASN